MLGARIAWSAVLLAVMAGPVLLWLRPGPTLWAQLSAITGLLALSALACTAVLPSRLRSLTRAFGIDGVHVLHRALGTASVALVLAHLACVVAEDPTNIALLNVATSTPPARAAVAAAAALAVLVALAVLRHRPRYEIWRWVHLALTAAALGLAGLHVWWLGRLVHDATMGPVLAALGMIVAAAAVYRWVWRPVDPAAEFLVCEVRRESPTVSTIVVEQGHRRRRRGPPPMRFMPGQFAWLRLARAPTAQEHPFTIASAAGNPRLEFVVRHRGDYARGLRTLQPGRRVWLDGPHGGFSVDAHRCDAVAMISAGVGIAPMLSMLRTAGDRHDERPYRLVQLPAPVDAGLFRPELTALGQRLDLVTTEIVPPQHLAPDGLTAAIGARPGRFHFFVCGPPQMVHGTVAVLNDLAIPPAQIHTERFDT